MNSFILHTWDKNARHGFTREHVTCTECIQMRPISEFATKTVRSYDILTHEQALQAGWVYDCGDWACPSCKPPMTPPDMQLVFTITVDFDSNRDEPPQHFMNLLEDVINQNSDAFPNGIDDSNIEVL